MTMTPKNSDYSSDESQPSEMEVEIPCSRPASSVNTTEVVSPPRSSDNSSVSPSGSSVSSSVVSYCDNHNPVSNNGRNKRKHETFPVTQQSSGNKVTESVSSLSVPSSPEPTISPCSKEQHVKESPVAYLYETRNHNHPQNRFSYGDLPRTAPCIVLSPSNSTNPVLFSHHNPAATYNPSSLIMPVPPPFQMFHHHQSTLMSKINPLCFKTVDVGMQRFREFCADHNFNSVGSGFIKPTKCVDDNVETGSEEKDFNNVIRNCGDKKPTKENEKQGERDTNDKSLRSQSPPAVMKRLSFGIDAILAQGKDDGAEKASEHSSEGLLDEEQGSNKDPISKRSLVSPPVPNSRQPILYQNPNNNHHHHPLNHSASSDHSHRLHSLSSASQSPLNLTNRCADCYLLGRYCRNNGTSSNLHYPSLVSSSSGVNGGGGVGGSTNGVSASFSPWITNASIYENSPLLSPSAYHTQSTLTSAYNMGSAGYSTMSSLVSCNNNGPGGRRKRSWSRAVFSSLQRKGLEKRFQIQKYITKPDRRQLAATLGLTDAQVKVWFQNRRMKWRHSKEGKVTSGVGDEGISVSTTVISSASNSSGSDGHRNLPVGASSSSPLDVKT